MHVAHSCVSREQLLSTIGAAKPSKNVQFDIAYAGFERTQAGVVELEAALRTYIMSLRGYHMSAQTLVTVIDKVGCDAENSVETKQFANDIKGGFVQLDGHLLNDSVKRFEQRVLKPATGWHNRARALKKQVAAYNEEKLIYDHYTRKVMALREARDKRAGSGKAEKPKDVEKLVRVRSAGVCEWAAVVCLCVCVSATEAHTHLVDLSRRTSRSTRRSPTRTRRSRTRRSPTYGTLSTVERTRSRRSCTGYGGSAALLVTYVVKSLMSLLLSPSSQMLEFRIKYAKDVHEESQKLQPLVKNGSKYEAILAQLDAFVGRLTGSAGSTLVQAAHCVTWDRTASELTDELAPRTTGTCERTVRARGASPELLVCDFRW